MSEENFVQSLIQALERPAHVETIDGRPFAITQTHRVVHDLERFLQFPTAIRQAVPFLDAESFIEYVKRFKQEGSLIFFDDKDSKFTAILDHHPSPESAAWCQHRATFEPEESVEWTRWTSLNNRYIEQVPMAQFLEDNILDVVEPKGAALLEICQTLEAKKSVHFASSIRLNNGQTQFVYEELIQGNAASGTMTIPEKFALGIPVFRHGLPYLVDCRLRYRLKDRSLLLCFEMVRIHKIVEDAQKALIEKVKTGTELAVLRARYPE